MYCVKCTKALEPEYGGEIMTLCFFFITDTPRSRGEIFNIPVDLRCLFCSASLNLLFFFMLLLPS